MRLFLRARTHIQIFNSLAKHALLLTENIWLRINKTGWNTSTNISKIVKYCRCSLCCIIILFHIRIYVNCSEWHARLQKKEVLFDNNFFLKTTSRYYFSDLVLFVESSNVTFAAWTPIMNMLDGDAKKVLFFKKKWITLFFCWKSSTGLYFLNILLESADRVFVYRRHEDSNVPIGKHLPVTFQPVHIHVPQSNCEGVEKTLFLNSCWL